ncbi:MAG TPA: class I SAM-dependent methyltransferase [Myxococcaceae bacterium]|nr:class I SAM-dependent methyltransferase [Myxococcaceae bacterium]
MTSPPDSEPGTKRDEDDLSEYDLPFFERPVVHFWGMLLGLITRLTDVLLLLWHPRLLRPYWGIWLAERLHSPYRARRTFEVVRALKATGQRFRELIYGETPLVTALLAFKRAGVGRRSRLVDLGAGRGRVLIAARWLGAEAHGVELLGEHVRLMATRLQPVGISLVEGDATRTDLRDATHVFTNWLALTPETKARLVERFRECQPGTRFITVTRPIESEGFRRLSHHWMLFTWGFERVWIHEYQPGP